MTVILPLLLLGYIRDRRLEEVMIDGDLMASDQPKSQRLLGLQEDVTKH